MVLGKVLCFRLLHSPGKQVGTWDLINVVISSQPAFITWLITTSESMTTFNFLSLIIENSATLGGKCFRFYSTACKMSSVTIPFLYGKPNSWQRKPSLLLFKLIYGICNPTSNYYVPSWVCEALQKLLLCHRENYQQYFERQIVHLINWKIIIQKVLLSHSYVSSFPFPLALNLLLSINQDDVECGKS